MLLLFSNMDIPPHSIGMKCFSLIASWHTLGLHQQGHVIERGLVPFSHHRPRKASQVSGMVISPLPWELCRLKVCCNKFA